MKRRRTGIKEKKKDRNQRKEEGQESKKRRTTGIKEKKKDRNLRREEG